MMRDASCAELVLDVETKTQRVILKKKVPLDLLLHFLIKFLADPCLSSLDSGFCRNPESALSCGG